MPYIYRVTRRTRRIPSVRAEVPTTFSESTASTSSFTVSSEQPEEESYRDLQARAKEKGIPANQTADDLRKALEKADD